MSKKCVFYQIFQKILKDLQDFLHRNKFKKEGDVIFNYLNSSDKKHCCRWVNKNIWDNKLSNEMTSPCICDWKRLFGGILSLHVRGDLNTNQKVHSTIPSVE